MSLIDPNKEDYTPDGSKPEAEFSGYRVAEVKLGDVKAYEITDETIKPPIGGGLEIGSYMADRVEAEHEPLTVEFTCTHCGDFINQDAEESLIIDLDALPVCSQKCLGERNHAIETGRQLDAAWRDFILLDEQEHLHRAFYKQLKKAAARIVELDGVGTHTQDEEGVVYEIVTKIGQWVDFTPWEVKRTGRETDAPGSKHLTLDRAEELGYTVTRKRAKAKKKEATND